MKQITINYIDTSELPNDYIENAKIIFPYEWVNKIQRYKIENDRRLSYCSFLFLFNYCKKNNISIWPKNWLELIKKNKKFFSLAHSEKYCVFYEGKFKVGIDIEKIKKISKIISITKTNVFSQNEREIIENSKDRLLSFLKIWGCKESYYKMFQKNYKNVIFNKSLSHAYVKNVFFNFDYLEDYLLTICSYQKDLFIEFKKIIM